MPASFANLADGGRRLAELIPPFDDRIVLAIVPNGVPAAMQVASALGAPLAGVRIVREPEPMVIELPDVAGREVVVIDDGVETGTAARLVGAALREAGAARAILAVPVCPREAEARLRGLYDDVIAVDRPMARRALRWHYDDLDLIDEEEALRQIAAYARPLG